MPTVTCLTEVFKTLAQTTARALGLPALPVVFLPHPVGSLQPEEIRQLADGHLGHLIEAATGAVDAVVRRYGLNPDTAGAPSALLPAMPPMSDNIEGLETFTSFMLEHGYGDGLPLIPPTRQRVSAAVDASGRQGDDLIGLVPPRFGPATVEQLAANAVMAGCSPEVMPIIIAAVQAMLEPSFDLYGIQTTTNPVAPLLLLNGPVRQQLGINCGTGALGPGWRANATIGRAIRLILLTIGGARPVAIDKATHGQPAKYSFCFGENEESSPWQPYHVDHGLAATDSSVTVIGAGGTFNIADVASRTAESLLLMLANSMNSVGTNDIHFGGQPLLVLCPEHARILAEGGWSKSQVQEYLLEHTAQPVELFSPENVEAIALRRPGKLWQRDGAVLIPIADSAEDIQIVVAGGPGPHSVFIPTFGNTRSVIRRIGGEGS